MIEVNNLTEVSVDEELLKQVGKQILDKEGIEEEVGISVALVGEDEIRKLNKIYRGKDEPTDVLSFKDESGFTAPPSQIKQMGEIVICPAQIKGGPGRDKNQEEIGRVFIHGLLHILGYTHQTEKESEIMETKQKNYLTFFQKHGSE